ncbi:amidase [Kineosporia sp. A_224]|uniref:amidase n=1 Tax=Kineosporia sp. A_224 TaxID=1962180 RepID=UPI000B4B03AE|nr:amidase [Kineosporia sp. A_224]
MTLMHRSAVSIAAAIRRREISAEEVVREAIDRAGTAAPLRALVWRNDEQALERAQETDAAIARGEDVGPFAGVPIPVKELTVVAGQPCTFGSLGVSDAPRDHDDLVVERLVGAGFVLFGRSNAPEAGPMSVTENRRFGVTRNPWNPAFSPAGSSGGAAVAVAAGITPVAHAGDGGGSIRMPSSATGLVGLKPSRGRVPAFVPTWEHSITDGVITRHVVDSAAVLDVLSGSDPRAPYSAPGPGRPFRDAVGADGPRLRIGVLRDSPSGVPVDPACLEAVDALALALEGQGHSIEPARPTLFSLEAIMGFLDIVINAWLWATPYDDPGLAEPYILARRRRATDFHAGEYAMAVARLYAESAQLVTQWGRDFDLLLTPTMATTPPLVGTVLEEANRDFAGPRLTENQMVAFTAFCNVAGLPAVSLPVHASPDGLPVGAQLVGAPFGEFDLLRIAASVEEHFGWATRFPDPSLWSAPSSESR